MRRFQWDFLKKEWQELDHCLLLLSVCLTAAGSTAIYSINLRTPALSDYWWQHVVTGGIGVIISLLLSRFPYDRLLKLHWVTYCATILFLVSVLLFGTIGGGAQSWLAIGNFNVQPSEFAKIGLIISLAAMIHYKPVQHFGDLARVLLVAAPPWLLVVVQPDLGTAIVFGAITLGMLYWGGTPITWLILLCSPIVSAVILHFSIPYWWVWVALMGGIAWLSLAQARVIVVIVAIVTNLMAGQLGKIVWQLLHEYQRQRLVLFLNPDQDPLGGGYHLIQSRIAIGAGQLWGKGFLQGSQTQLNFIPEQHTDFVFSAIGEEWGFAGSITVLLLFLLLCWRLLWIALQCRDNFGSLLVVGIFTLILFQAVINIGMTIGLAPVTGIPLPFVSYGRSALVMVFLGIGIIQSIVVHHRSLGY